MVTLPDSIEMLNLSKMNKSRIKGVFIFTSSEKDEDYLSLADTRAISASDDEINQDKSPRLELHGGSNPNVSSKLQINLSPLTRQLSSSVPDLSKKPEKK